MKRHSATTTTMATAVAALLLAACGGADSGDAEAGLAAGSSEEDTVDCSPGSDAATAATVLEGPLRPGEHSTGQLGTKVTFAHDQKWLVPQGASVPGGLVLQAKETPVPLTRFLLMMRDFDFFPTGETGGDVDALLSSRPDVETIDRREDTVGGSDAVVVDLAMDTAAPPLLFSEVGAQPLGPDELARIWVIDQEGASPIGILAVVVKRDADWLDTTANAVVDSIELGDPRELDVTAASACQVQAAVERAEGGARR